LIVRWSVRLRISFEKPEVVASAESADRRDPVAVAGAVRLPQAEGKSKIDIEFLRRLTQDAPVAGTVTWRLFSSAVARGGLHDFGKVVHLFLSGRWPFGITPRSGRPRGFENMPVSKKA